MGWFSALWEWLNKPEDFPHIARNAPCPCGSGKKYKHCCLERDEEHERDIINRVPFDDKTNVVGGGGAAGHALNRTNRWRRPHPPKI